MKIINRHNLIFTMLAALVVLSACSASPQDSQAAAESNPVSPIEFVEDTELEPVEAPAEQSGEVASLGYIVADEGEMPLEVQLGIGILRLEEMGLGLTTDQVVGQLDLWTSAQTLVQGNDRDVDQISAICIQIQDGLSPEQLNALHTTGFGALTNEEVTQELSAYAQASGRNPGGGGEDQAPGRPEGERPQGERQGDPGQGKVKQEPDHQTA